MSIAMINFKNGRGLNLRSRVAFESPQDPYRRGLSTVAAPDRLDDMRTGRNARPPASAESVRLLIGLVLA